SLSTALSVFRLRRNCHAWNRLLRPLAHGTIAGERQADAITLSCALVVLFCSALSRGSPNGPAREKAGSRPLRGRPGIAATSAANPSGPATHHRPGAPLAAPVLGAVQVDGAERRSLRRAARLSPPARRLAYLLLDSRAPLRGCRSDDRAAPVAERRGGF